LRPSRRRAIRGLVADEDAVVEHLLDDLGRDAGAVVRDGESDLIVIEAHVNPDLGRDPRRLAGVQGVIHQLLEADARKLGLPHAGERRQTPGVEILGGTRNLERGSL
jgi:hypothetical protein